MFIMVMSEDTTTVDSAVVYEIPEIVLFGFDSTDRILYKTQDIVPNNSDFDLADALSCTPFMLMKSGRGQQNLVSRRGQDAKRTTIYLNNHRIENQLFGYINLSKIPVQFLEKISISHDYLGTQDINLTSKVNHYDKPFSSVKYATGDFGMDLYNADLTRPITNDLGFYLSGLHWYSQGHRPNSQYKISSFYTNLYYNQLIPMRIDLIYFSNEFGFPGDNSDSTLNGFVENEFVDACFTCGNSNNKITVYHTVDNHRYSDTIQGLSHRNNNRNYGVDIANLQNFKGFEIISRLTGIIGRIDSDPYGSHSVNSLKPWIGLSKSFNNLILCASNLCEFRNTEDFLYAPQFSIGFDIFDSTYLFANLSKAYRTPSISETSAPDSIFEPYSFLRGNEALQTEYCWLQEIGIKRKNFFLTFYNYNYDNIIVVQSDSDDYYTPANLDTWQSMGIEQYLKASIFLSDNPDAKSATEISAGYSGNYLFKGDSLPLTPKSNSSFFVSFERRTEKFDLCLTIKEQFVGNRKDFHGEEIDPFRIFSATGELRFIDLSFILTVDNILNNTGAFVPDHTIEPRHLDFIVKWKFWD